MDRNLAKRVKAKTYYGQDLVARPRRLALMNLFLHGIEPHIVFLPDMSGRKHAMSSADQYKRARADVLVAIEVDHAVRTK